jgi:NADPH:quinone reductase-like Zn-dependent oxidoreductase
MVRVRASSINYGDHVLLTGRPRAARLALGLFRPKQRIMGMDVAGQVHALGADVQGVSLDDAVYGEAIGAYAEYVCVDADKLAPMPHNLDFEQAASAPIAAVTALKGLRDKANVQPGDRVLVNGASGGVGSFAVQIAKAFGAEVTAVCSARNQTLARFFGADHLVDYQKSDFTQTSQRYDAIFDFVGSAPISACRQLLTERGTYIASVGSFGWMIKAFVYAAIFKGRIKPLAAQCRRDDLLALNALFEAEKIRPVIDRRYRFTTADIREAFAYQAAGHTRGKSVITIS